MKKSRMIVTIVMFILFLLTALLNNKVQAMPVEPAIYFGIAEMRTTTNMGYAMGNPEVGSKKIWKIVKYKGESTNDPTEVSAYCINAETGFTNTGDKDKYDVSYNMKTERERDAKEFRAQGQQQAQQIRASADKEKTIILAEANKKAQIIRGNGDKKAIEIWNNAANQDIKFFTFYRSMEAYRNSLQDSSLVLSPDSEFFKYFGESTVR